MANKPRESASAPPSGRSADMGDTEAAYAAVDASDDHEGLVRTADAAESATSRERRLTLRQLERFQRAALRKATGGGKGGRDPREPFDDLFSDAPGDGASPRRLHLTVYPWGYWLCGALMLLGTSVFVARVRAHALGYTPEEASQAHDWWKYAVAGVVLLVALGLLGSGRVETLSLDQDAGVVALRSARPLCLGRLRRERRVERALRAVADVRVEASGEFSGDVDTRCYAVHLEFSDGAHARALESRSKRTTLRRCRDIKAFLLRGLELPDEDAAEASDAQAGGEPGGAGASPEGAATAPLPSVPSASLPRRASAVAPVDGTDP